MFFTVLANSCKIKLSVSQFVLVDVFEVSLGKKTKLAKTMLETSVELTYGLTENKVFSLHIIDTYNLRTISLTNILFCCYFIYVHLKTAHVNSHGGK